MARSSFFPDRFTVMLIGTVALASLLPAYGRAADALTTATTIVVSVLFFLHGAKLSRKAIWDGITHWRLHLLVVFCWRSSRTDPPGSRNSDPPPGYP
jgi:sodium/bile acid cotransporter 7